MFAIDRIPRHRKPHRRLTHIEPGNQLHRGQEARLGRLMSAVIGLGYVDRIDADKAQWALASTLQQRELKALRRALPDPPSGARVLLFGAPAYTASGVPIFAAPWDLNGAVKLLWHDGSVSAYPVIAGTVVVCGSAAVIPVGAEYDVTQQAPYGTGFRLLC